MKEITLNGAKFKVAANTMEELKNEALGDKNSEMYKFLAKFNASEPDIFILDGFATKENLELKEGSNVVFIRRGVMPGREQCAANQARKNFPLFHFHKNIFFPLKQEYSAAPQSPEAAQL